MESPICSMCTSLTLRPLPCTLGLALHLDSTAQAQKGFDVHSRLVRKSDNITVFFLAVYLCAFQTFRPPTRSRLLLYMSFDPKLAWKAGKPCRNAGDLKVLEWIAMTLAAHSSSIYVSQNNHAMRPPAGQQAFDMLLGIPVFFVLTRGRE